MEINACLLVPGLRFCAFCCCEFCHFEPFSLTNNDSYPGVDQLEISFKKKTRGSISSKFHFKSPGVNI